MLNGSQTHDDEANVENNKPISLVSSGDGVSKTRQALLKKGGKKLRTTAALHHQKAPRNTPSIRLSDHNNNNNNILTASSAKKPAAPSAAEPPLKPGTKKEMLKSKGGRLERGTTQPSGQPARNLPRRDAITQNTAAHSRKPKQGQTAAASHATKRKDNASPHKSPSQHQNLTREQKKPLHASSNVKIIDAPPAESLKDGDKVYAGAKFSEPPLPSVLPKPPSHWVGENEPQQDDQSRERMTVHLKLLLKVQDKS